ncbi:MarR family winged helix-turn-helix transcriptional regulator [Streptomyces sp. NPDC090306]|uniref:MarR family winged helix-turn-helix transcriptional regulator n=1 Tax=unclassified Streptomyces TaxID=2593676 RepID=UPI0036EBEBCB
MADAEILRLSGDLRVACARIARRTRLESGQEIPQHLYSVLVRLESGPSTARQLADLERVSPPAMTRSVSALDTLGHVRREPDTEDGRRTIVRITPSGRRVLERVRGNRDAWMVARISQLSDQERELLTAATAVLQKIETA